MRGDACDAIKSIGHTCSVAIALVNYYMGNPDYEVKLLSLMLLLNHSTEILKHSPIMCILRLLYYMKYTLCLCELKLQLTWTNVLKFIFNYTHA